MTHVCVGKLTIIGPVNGLSPGRCQAIVWANGGILLNSKLRNKLQWNLKRNSYIAIHENAFVIVVCEMVASFLGLNVLTFIICRRMSSLMMISYYGNVCHITWPLWERLPLEWVQCWFMSYRRGIFSIIAVTDLLYQQNFKIIKVMIGHFGTFDLNSLTAAPVCVCKVQAIGLLHKLNLVCLCH